MFSLWAVGPKTSNPLSVRISELEAGLKTMADHVLQRQSQVEKLTTERATLRLQLDNELARSKVALRSLVFLRFSFQSHA